MEDKRKEEIKMNDNAYINERLILPQKGHSFEFGFPLNCQDMNMPYIDTLTVISATGLEYGVPLSLIDSTAI